MRLHVKLIYRVFNKLGRLSCNIPKPSVKPFMNMKDAFMNGREEAKRTKPTTTVHTEHKVDKEGFVEV